MTDNKKPAVADERQAKVEVKPQPTHRYYCDACTGIAFLHVEGAPLPKNPVCKACGKPVGTVKQENFIKL